MTRRDLLAAAAFVALASAAGASLAQIRIGQTAGFSGAVAAGVKETTDGAKLYIDSINAKGGVAGQKIELVSLDDKFDPKLAAENARKLIAEQQVVGLFLNRGTPHTEAIMPLLEQFGVPLVAPSTGAMVLHEPPKKHIFNVRSTYQLEAEHAVAHLTNLEMKRVGILHVDDSFGADGAAGAMKGFAKAKVQPLFTERYDRAKPDFSAIAPRIAAAKPQAIIFVGSGAAVVEGVKAVKAAGARPQFVTLSNNASGGFIKQLGEHARGMIVTQVYPFESARSTPMVYEASELAKAKGIPELSPAMLEGFAGAKVLVEGLRRAGPKVTRESLQKGLESIKEFDLGGHVITYGPRDREGLVYSDLAIVGQDGRFKR